MNSGADVPCALPLIRLPENGLGERQGALAKAPPTS